MTTADELRRVVLALPEAEERETWGHPTFRARDKLFAALSDDGQGRDDACRPGEGDRPAGKAGRPPSDRDQGGQERVGQAAGQGGGPRRHRSGRGRDHAEQHRAAGQGDRGLGTT